MIIAVLIDSRKVGSSGWINVRSTQVIRVRGMQEGDELLIHGKGLKDNLLYHMGKPDMIDEDTTFLINGQEVVKAEIVKVSEGSRIYVDLE